MNKRERAAIGKAVGRQQQTRAILLEILKEGMAFVNQAATEGGGNTLDQCRAMHRRFRLAKVLLGLGQTPKKPTQKKVAEPQGPAKHTCGGRIGVGCRACATNDQSPATPGKKVTAR